MKFITTALSLYAAFVVSGDALYAQTQRQPRGQPPPAAGESLDEDDVVRVETTLVTVPVSVIDREGRYVTSLRQGDFRLYEDGVEQQIAFFNSVDEPIFVVLLIDTSGSTRPSLRAIKDAAIAFVRQLRPSDVVLPVSFDSRIHTPLRAPTNDQSLLTTAINDMQSAVGAYSGTGLYDAIEFVTKRIFKPSRRNAMILFTDGGDTGSKATGKSTLYDATEINALVYSVYYAPLDLGPGAKLTKLPPPDKGYIRELAEKTGGRFFEPKDPEKINRTMTTIADELRRQYSLGYYPKEKAQVKQQRRIKVRTSLPKVLVRARNSYIYTPVEQR